MSHTPRLNLSALFVNMGLMGPIQENLFHACISFEPEFSEMNTFDKKYENKDLSKGVTAIILYTHMECG